MIKTNIVSEIRRQKIRGCLLGGAVGDALGAPVEFMSKVGIQKQFGQRGIHEYVEFPGAAGAITDDTQMTLFTAEGLLRGLVRSHDKGICSISSVVYYAYQRWLKTQGYVNESLQKQSPDFMERCLSSGWLIQCPALYHQRAPGNSCLSALQAPRIGAIGAAVNNSKGCGTVMRMAPAGLMGGQAFELGRDLSALTHGHPSGYYAGAALADLIQRLLEDHQQKSIADCVNETLLRLKLEPQTGEVTDALEAALNMAASGCPLEAAGELGEGWVAEETLAISVFCAIRAQNDFQRGVLAAVNIDGDSDSAGAVTGNILGVYLGEQAIPARWIEQLREHRIVEIVADDLCRRIDLCQIDASHWMASREWLEKYPGF